jgi:uncharacterized protein Yka (UPF0111/DUF47 family)
MNILTKLLEREDPFLELLAAGAEEAQRSIQLLSVLLRDSTHDTNSDALIETRRQEQRITEQLSDELGKTFVTSVEREDLEDLSVTLAEIPKLAEKFSDKFRLCRDAANPMTFARQGKLLEAAAALLMQMIHELRERKNLAAIKEQNQKLHDLHDETLRLTREQVCEFEQQRQEPLRVFIAMELHDVLEALMERYRAAGNVLFRIVQNYI